MRPLVICCSQRFKLELDLFVPFLRKRDVLVNAPNFTRHRKDFIAKPEHIRLRTLSYRKQIEGLVLAHLSRIDEMRNQGGISLIFNPEPKENLKKPYGYIGDNTHGEIFYAAAAPPVPTIAMRPTIKADAMTLIYKGDKNRIFTMAYPKADPLDYDFVWEKWLKRWLNA